MESITWDVIFPEKITRCDSEHVKVIKVKSNKTIVSCVPVQKLYPLVEQHCGKAAVMFGVCTISRTGWTSDPSAR